MENAATSSVQDLAAEKEEANTMETFRDFVEKIVVGLIGNMDVPINRVVYHHSPCKLKHIEILYKHVYTNCFYLSLVYTRKFYPVLLILFFFFLISKKIEKGSRGRIDGKSSLSKNFLTFLFLYFVTNKSKTRVPIFLTKYN